MPGETSPDIKLEIGHVLFIDIVGYSKLNINEQSEQLETLKAIARGTKQFQKAEAEGKLLRLPTGDGGALVFRNSPEAPVLCALELTEALQKPPGSKDKPRLRLRMGIHSGPVNEITDLNEQANIAGAGINIAQRVMNSGDAGHILVSKHVAEDLETYPRWQPYLHDLGECEVKHGVRIGMANLYNSEVGNPQLPKKFEAVRKRRSHVRWAEVAVGLLIVGAIISAFMIVSRRPTVALNAALEKSIAVLPFANMSSDKEQEYFSDGISEELLNLLARIPQLKVAARVSSFSFKDKGVEIPEIGQKLRVAHVLEGSVRKSGDQVRITAQLIHASDGFHMWSRTWDRKLDDIFKIQDEIAADVVKELKVTLLGEAPKTRPTDPKAYALYLQAVQLGQQGTLEAYEKSNALYRQVLEIDPRYAPAWSKMAANFVNESAYNLVPIQEGLGRAREAAENALEIDPEYANAYCHLGYIAEVVNDLSGAARHYERALALDPTDLNVLSNVALFLKNLGRLNEALALNEFLVGRDPVDVLALNNLAGNQRFVGRFDEAISTCRTLLNLSPGRGGTHLNLGLTMLQKGDASGALAEMQRETDEFLRTIGLPMAYHALGRNADSDAALAALIAKHEKDASYNIAYIYAFRGEADKAFQWLDKAVEYNDPGLAEILAENLFANIRSDPRWLPFLRKIGKAPDQLDKIQLKVTLPP